MADIKIARVVQANNTHSHTYTKSGTNSTTRGKTRINQTDKNKKYHKMGFEILSSYQFQVNQLANKCLQ